MHTLKTASFSMKLLWMGTLETGEKHHHQKSTDLLIFAFDSSIKEIGLKKLLEALEIL